MTDWPTLSTDRVIVLVKAGRLQSWDHVSPEKQRDYTREHVDLVMEVGHRHGITRLEAFRLMGYQQPWHRFWVIEFPTLEGAEEWIQAEMAPPYGSHGYWEYYLARPWGRDYFSTWVTRERKPMPPLQRTRSRGASRGSRWTGRASSCSCSGGGFRDPTL